MSPLARQATVQIMNAENCKTGQRCSCSMVNESLIT